MNFAHLPFLLVALIPALTFHEWAHAFVARRFGDDTAERHGRLTLNPLAHLDILGTLAIMLIGFGWAKPVPIDPRNFKSSWAEFFVAAAGPFMNFALAALFAIMLRTNMAFQFGAEHTQIITTIFRISLVLNLSLGVFNLIPIGPLDGHSILSRLLPLRSSIQFDQWNSQYGHTILFGAVIVDSIFKLNILRTIVGVPVMFFQQILLGF